MLKVLSYIYKKKKRQTCTTLPETVQLLTLQR